MKITLCAWHTELPRPRRWFRIKSVILWPLWPVLVSHGICIPCARRWLSTLRAGRTTVTS